MTSEPQDKVVNDRLFDQTEARKLAEASLRSIVLSTAQSRGENFFRQLVQDLASALDVFYVIAGEVCVVDGVESIRTLAVWAGQDYMPNITYGLACTPCRNVSDQSMCYHPSGIQQEYPLDTLLADMKAESYIGMPMVGTNGKTLGILVALDVRPMDDNKRLLALSLLSIFSARCAAELEHHHREKELEFLVQERTRELNETRDKLVESEKLSALGGLVAGMAHEINTPIGIAVTSASSLEEYARDMEAALTGDKVSRSALTELSAGIREGTDLVLRNLERAANLIGNFKKLAVDQASDDCVDLILADYVESICGAHLPEFKRHQVGFKIDIPSSLKVQLPIGMLAQVLSNLLMNALKHAFDGRSNGLITVSAKAEKSCLLLQIIDNGVGVSAEVRTRMFEPFFTTKRGQGGTGLGLHIVYTIIKRLGGDVTLSSEIGQGLCVNVRLPNCVLVSST